MADGLSTRAGDNRDVAAVDRNGTGILPTVAADGGVSRSAVPAGQKYARRASLPPNRQGIALRHLDALWNREGRAVAEDEVHVAAHRDTGGNGEIVRHGIPAAVEA